MARAPLRKELCTLPVLNDETVKTNLDKLEALCLYRVEVSHWADTSDFYMRNQNVDPGTGYKLSRGDLLKELRRQAAYAKRYINRHNVDACGSGLPMA